MKPAFDVCIRGAGVVGQSLALLLAGLRLRVGLVETHPNAAADVRAFALNAASKNLLQSLRCWPSAEHATPVQRMRVWGDGGAQVQLPAPTPEGLSWIVDVPVLQAQLAQAIQFQPLITMLGEPASASLSVVCEGRNSASRAHMGAAHEVLPYDQHAVAARVQCSVPHHGQAFQWFNHENGELDILALLPMGGATGQQAALVWSLSPARAAQLQAMPVAEFEQALHHASHDQLGALSLTSERRSWPLLMARAAQWCGHDSDGSAWVLAGDAAHSVHPLAGLGLNLGLADVQALHDVLQTRQGINHWRPLSDRHLLRQYERQRKAGMWPTWVACDGLQRLFAHPHALAKDLRQWGMKNFDTITPLKQWVIQQAMQ
jgi:2-polyprenyl-6-methoxyphenol hydroxylase-like FAD-dependent oxidoreductase